MSIPPSWEKPRSIASSPHVVLVVLVSIEACCQFATHRVLSFQVSTMPVVCQLRQAVTFPFRTSILSARVQCSTRTSPITDIWLSFSFSYSHSVKKLRVWHLTKFLLFLFTSREILLKNWRLHSYFESIPHRLPFFECIIFWCENLDLVMIMVLCAELPPGKKHPKYIPIPIPVPIPIPITD